MCCFSAPPSPFTALSLYCTHISPAPSSFKLVYYMMQWQVQTLEGEKELLTQGHGHGDASEWFILQR